MTEPGSAAIAATARPRWTRTRTILCAAAIVIAVEAVLLATSNKAVLQGVLFDPDCYMHLTRALRLMQGQGWNGFDPRINAPFGYAVHWTSLFDALLAAGAWPLHWMGLSVHDALYLWGSAISPLLLILALAAFGAGVRPLVSGLAFLWLTVLVFTQPEFSGAFLAGRPDHHSLILGLTLAQIGWLCAALDGRAGVRLALAAGAAAGVQLCTTVEALVTILLACIVLALAWALYGKPVLRLLALYLGACLAAVIGWLAATRGGLFFAPAYDRASIVHVAVLTVGLAGVGLIALLARRKIPPLVALALAGAAAGAVVAVVYPDFFLGPWPHIDPVMQEWHRGISELQPILPTNSHHLAQFLAQFTAALLALPLTLHLLRHGNAAERMAMLVCACGFCLFGALALAQMRWSGELQAAMLLPWTLTTQRIMKSSRTLSLGAWRVPLRSFALAGALLLQIVPGVLAPARAVPSMTRTSCDWSGAARALGHVPQQQGIVLAELWYGPEILWRTQFDVIGAPYEIPPALIDSNRFADGDVAQAREVLARRHVSLVLNCGALRDADALGLKPAPFTVPGFRLYRAR